MQLETENISECSSLLENKKWCAMRQDEKLFLWRNAAQAIFIINSKLNKKWPLNVVFCFFSPEKTERDLFNMLHVEYFKARGACCCWQSQGLGGVRMCRLHAMRHASTFQQMEQWGTETEFASFHQVWTFETRALLIIKPIFISTRDTLWAEMSFRDIPLTSVVFTSCQSSLSPCPVS